MWVVVGLALIVYSFSSYPLMQPGLDIWWHLAMTEAPQKVDPQVFSTIRLSWHHFWHQSLALVGLVDVFDRALLIHRTQTFLTLVLLAVSAYWTLRSITHQLNFDKRLILLASMISAAMWPLIHGTASVPHGGDANAPLVLSWLVWYSVNYQISLPLYFAGTSALLYALSVERSTRHGMLYALITASFIVIGTLLHAAETAYFLVALVFLMLLYLRGRRALWLAVPLLLSSGLVLWLALSSSYVVPDLLLAAGNGEWSALFNQILRRGEAMTDGGLNRADTGWHTMHTLSLLALAFSGFCLYHHSIVTPNQRKWDARPLVFTMLTALMPLGLLCSASAGFLSMLITPMIAWRFAFASFLFVGIPLFALVCVHRVPKSYHAHRSALFILTVALFSALGLGYSNGFEARRPVFQYGNSLIRSLDAHHSQFNLDASQRLELARLASALRKRPDLSAVCTDMPTAYYLFFVERYSAPALPAALSYLPGYRSPEVPCNFPPDNAQLRGLLLAPMLPNGNLDTGPPLR